MSFFVLFNTRFSFYVILEIYVYNSGVKLQKYFELTINSSKFLFTIC
jgi:hypothetical protein